MTGCVKLNHAESAALRAAGFEVDDDNELARISSGGITVEVIRLRGSSDFYVETAFPNGTWWALWNVPHDVIVPDDDSDDEAEGVPEQAGV